MPNHLMCDLAQAEGYCCEDTYMLDKSNIRSAVLAKHLGIDKRSVNKHRQRLRKGETRCNGTCKNAYKLFKLYLVRAEKELRADGTYYRIPAGSTMKGFIYRKALDMWVEMYTEKTFELTGKQIDRTAAMKVFRDIGVENGGQDPGPVNDGGHGTDGGTDGG